MQPIIMLNKQSKLILQVIDIMANGLKTASLLQNDR